MLNSISLFRSLFKIFMVFSSLLICLSCDDETKTGQCGYHTDCPIPERCLEGQCRLECRVSTDCEQAERCFEGVCYLRPEVCRDDEECAPFQEVCDPRTLLCVPPGELSVDANGGALSAGSSTSSGGMTNGDVSAGTEAGSPAGVEGNLAGTEAGNTAGSMSAGSMSAGSMSAGSMSAGSMSAGSMSAGSMSAGETGGAPAGTGAYGDDCNCPSDCMSGFCVVNKMKRRRTCSDGCDTDVDCPGIDTCLQAQVSPASDLCPDSPSSLPPPGSIVGVCVPNETAYPCNDPSECTSGICLTPPQVVPWTSPQPVCTMACNNDYKCPVGYRCGQVGGIEGNVCVEEAQVSPCPSGDALSCGGVCPVPNGRDEADLAVCLNGFNQTEGYCTCTCASASDCPSGFGCSDIGDTGDPTRPNVCIPFAGAACPLSDQGVEQCLSTTCLVDEDDSTLNRCTAFCAVASDCPSGYECINVGDASVCLPRAQ